MNPQRRRYRLLLVLGLLLVSAGVACAPKSPSARMVTRAREVRAEAEQSAERALEQAEVMKQRQTELLSAIEQAERSLEQRERCLAECEGAVQKLGLAPVKPTLPAKTGRFR